MAHRIYGLSVALGDFAYPAERVAIYACHERRCSLPVEDPADLAEQIRCLYRNSGG